MVILEEPDLNCRGEPFRNRDGSIRMKNLSVTKEVYISKILEPFKVWAAQNGLWREIDGRGKLIGCMFMQDGEKLKI